MGHIELPFQPQSLTAIPSDLCMCLQAVQHADLKILAGAIGCWLLLHGGASIISQASKMQPSVSDHGLPFRHFTRVVFSSTYTMAYKTFLVSLSPGVGTHRVRVCVCVFDSCGQAQYEDRFHDMQPCHLRQ